MRWTLNGRSSLKKSPVTALTRSLRPMALKLLLAIGATGGRSKERQTNKKAKLEYLSSYIIGSIPVFPKRSLLARKPTN